MDAEKTAWIESAFKFRDGLINGVAMTIDHGVGELVMRNEMGNCIEV
jgi:hypothetical protein